MKVLHIIASPRGSKSRTLDVASEFISTVTKRYPQLQVDEMDLFKTKLPEILEDSVDAKFALMSGGQLGDRAKIWQEISKYSTDFLSYDVYVISNPMWNFTIPYKLKHYIDVIMQAGILFSFNEKGVEGLALNKKMYCITSRGNDYSEQSPMHAFDFQEPYLRSIFGLAGIHDIHFINAQPMDIAPGLTQSALEAAREKARNLANECNL